MTSIGTIPAHPLNRYAGKRVFVTGHTGFKGSWLSLWLAELGARITGYALAPPTEPNNFGISKVREVLHRHHEADIRDIGSLRRAIEEAAPEVILHLAAQPLVRDSYRDPRYTFEVNFMGTVNLLEIVRDLGLACTIVVITSDKCYENREWLWAYREDDAMGGYDPYSASKGAVEVLVSSYRRSFFPADGVQEHGVRLATARAGNVIGGGDWSPDHIVVDVVAGLMNNKPIAVRNPHAVRPWQHVLESLNGYLTLGSAMMGDETGSAYSAGWNFGPELADAVTVRELVELFINAWGQGQWIDAHDPSQPHEAGFLRLSIEKAQLRLGWSPRWTVAHAVEQSVAWYRAYLEDPQHMRDVCLEQIRAYQKHTQ